MILHPATQILSWCVLVAAMQFLAPERLLIAGGLALLVALLLSRHKFVQLLRRTRWIMFSLWLIYGYSTPGQPLSEAIGVFSPSCEGMLDGGLQMLRLLIALAGLALLLDRLHRQQLIAGLYSLFAPLQGLGLSRARIAVRLALTLHYAEVAMLRSVSWQDNLRSLTTTNSKLETENRVMELPACRFAYADALLIVATVTLFWLAIQ